MLRVLAPELLLNSRGRVVEDGVLSDEGFGCGLVVQDFWGWGLWCSCLSRCLSLVVRVSGLGFS